MSGVATSAADVAIEWDRAEAERDNISLLARQHDDRRGGIMLGGVLLVVGIVMLTCATFIATGVIDADYWYPGEGWEGPCLTFFLIGFVTCLPGTYSLRIAYHVYRGTPGYSLSQLPQMR
mmetsp:Transcript_85457/g.125054  ORF Transcript_85457/g.125054 Transcript_85457/m.125054 type:complete len:120 (-) Transcript_85457:579-938(-)|eukprot:CAMPEP_0179428694 /NCGR_PEP_ID=MMETSP0799-20121207/14293_1 /TAXON_ID=46947 /ORGANISM="Geminigera cryophila, Strain CCMP2564" /LENGTH=119 /DNA_ID=CAMNT_0021204299 /DNA_START=180 /DNA_END=539 /DNA_ORIENTATION=+